MDLLMALVVTLMTTSAVAFFGFAVMDGSGLRWSARRTVAASTSERPADARPSLLPRTIRHTPID